MTIKEFKNVGYTISKSTTGVVDDFDISEFIDQIEDEYDCPFEEINEIDIYESFQQYIENEFPDILCDEELIIDFE